MAEKYGVWQEKSRYGRKYMGIVRTTYLIGPDGKVAQRWDNVKVDGHVEDERRRLPLGSSNTQQARVTSDPYSVARRRIALRETLPRLVDVAVEDEQPIGVAIGIGEVELLALAQLHPQVLLQIVHLRSFPDRRAPP